jgi:hypothetical protein
MGWEKRGRHRYYVRKRNVNGQSIRTYFGRGPVAEQAAVEDAERRRARERERAEWKQLEAMDTELEELYRNIDLLSKGALIREGFHQHHRGNWRRWRNGKHTITCE